MAATATATQQHTPHHHQRRFHTFARVSSSWLRAAASRSSQTRQAPCHDTSPQGQSEDTAANGSDVHTHTHNTSSSTHPHTVDPRTHIHTTHPRKPTHTLGHRCNSCMTARRVRVNHTPYTLRAMIWPCRSITSRSTLPRGLRKLCGNSDQRRRRQRQQAPVSYQHNGSHCSACTFTHSIPRAVELVCVGPTTHRKAVCRGAASPLQRVNLVLK